MKVPLEITYRGVDKSDAIDALVHEKVAKLEQFCNYMSSCHIAIEKVHDRPSSGSPYRVRIDMTVPPSHELVAESNPGEGTQYTALDTVIRDAFNAANRQLKELNERQRNRVKTHEAQDMTAVVIKLFREQGYGFIKTFDDQEVYFHQNSVLNNDFDRLEVGTGVHIFVTDGEQGPQASTVRIVDKPGVGVGKSDADTDTVEAPLGWQ